MTDEPVALPAEADTAVRRGGGRGSKGFDYDPNYRVHMEINEGPRGGLPSSVLYPDWTEQDTWVLTGTWGTAQGWNAAESARRFTSVTEAKAFYQDSLGKPLEVRLWGFGPNEGGRWGLRFRLPRPAVIPYPQGGL